MDGIPLIDRVVQHLRLRGPMFGHELRAAMRPHASEAFAHLILLEAVLSGRLMVDSDLKLSLPR